MLNYDIKIIQDDKDIKKCFPVMQSLVNNLQKNTVLEKVKRKKIALI